MITGIVKETTAAAYTVATATEMLTISKADVEEMKPTPQSMMPDDQLKPMKDEEVRALFAYLQNPVQVPLAFFGARVQVGDGPPVSRALQTTAPAGFPAAARMAAACLAHGYRVGVTSQSHLGTSGLISRMGRGVSLQTRFSTAAVLSAGNGGWPVRMK